MIDNLNAQFSIPDAISIRAGMNDLPKIILTQQSGARAEVYLYGAHLTSWIDATGAELLLLSRQVIFEPGRAIRGGIPVIFPQFGSGALPQHGLARISEWQLADTGVLADGALFIELSLRDSSETLAHWPHPFGLCLKFTLRENSLTIDMRVDNTGTESFDFQAVLHSYFRVANIQQTALQGLEGVTFIDTLRGNIHEVETRPSIRFDVEIDRIYQQAPDYLQLDDEGNARQITIEKQQMPDVVVWNPWIVRSQQLHDLADDDYLNFVCVETGNMATTLPLLPGKSWQGKTILRSQTI